MVGWPGKIYFHVKFADSTLSFAYLTGAYFSCSNIQHNTLSTLLQKRGLTVPVEYILLPGMFAVV